MPQTLTDDARQRLRDHALRARAALAKGDRATAEREFLAAWDCIPQPYGEYEQSQTAARAMVEFYRDGGQPEKARHWLGIARNLYANATSIVAIDFLGATVAFDAGEFDAAFEAFDALYKRFKSRPFDGQPKKYLEFYRQRAAGR